MAAFPWYLLLFICFVFLLFYCYYWRNDERSRTSAPTNWPVVGMLPGLLQNAHRIHDFATQILKENGGTFELKGPRFANMDMLVTSDPANIHHILSKNFPNYPKGPEFTKMFEILGDGIFNADFELWEFHRKATMSLLKHPKFLDLLHRTIWNKVEKGLIPLLEKRPQVDLQEIFQRFSFDSICSLFLDYDPQSLSIDFPFIPCEKAFTDTEEALLRRHVLPESVWRLQQRLQIGKEKILSENWKTFDRFLFPLLSLKQEEVNREKGFKDDFCFLTSFVDGYTKVSGVSVAKSDKFLRDTFLSLMIAGRDTTSTALTWFFWLLGQNPRAETQIVEEIKDKLLAKKGDEQNESLRCFNGDELRKMVYLHGAICEALRLFPPVGLEHKAPLNPEILPSGHTVDPKTKIILSFYSMGRMESIWGKDCLMFKPERWISEKGGTKHEPSYKFPAFNAGPRTCLGKEMAFIQIKIVAISIICNYHVQVVDDQPITPSSSIILQKKYGLKVRLSRRT